jgi:hypothetical protein
MTKEELAEKLNGREYGQEITREEAAEASVAGLIVMFGASDDLVEINGALDEELGAHDGTKILLGDDGELVKDVDEDEGDDEVLAKYDVLDYVRDRASGAKKVEVVWCGEKDGPSWTFETDIPHATFDIKEDDEVFCRGIVIDKRDLAVR